MEHLRNFLCGAVIGVAEIIPGVSGGTLAVLLGVYDKLIAAISRLKENFKKNLLFLVPVVLGMGVSILALSHVIGYLLEHYPMAVNFFFLGLIVGIIPMILRRATKGGLQPVSLIPFFLTLAAMVALFAVPKLLGTETSGAVIETMSAGVFFRFLGVGALAALCFILPGISGSMIMVIFGIYNSVIAAISKLNIVMLIPVAIGALGGLLFGARLVDVCLKKAPRAAYMAILGLVLGSILSVADRAGFRLFTAEGAVAIVTALAGIAISLLMSSKKVQALTGGAEESDAAEEA